MAQEDKGLVLRGLLLLAAVGIIITAVLAMLFWRPTTQPATLDAPPEHYVPAVVLPSVGGFPAGISWYAIFEMGKTMPSAPGSDVRYAAATALARRGSAEAPWPLLREMLDERQQLKNNRVRLKDGRDVYDEANARLIMVSALRAIAVWHEKQADKKQEIPPELRDIYAVVDELAKSDFVELKVQAEKARATFFR